MLRKPELGCLSCMNSVSRLCCEAIANSRMNFIQRTYAGLELPAAFVFLIWRLAFDLIETRCHPHKPAHLLCILLILTLQKCRPLPFDIQDCLQYFTEAQALQPWRLSLSYVIESNLHIQCKVRDMLQSSHLRPQSQVFHVPHFRDHARRHVHSRYCSSDSVDFNSICWCCSFNSRRCCSCSLDQ